MNNDCNIKVQNYTSEIRTCEMYIGNPEIGSGTKLLFTFLSLRFFDTRRERHNFFNKCAAHFVDPNLSCLGETKNRLISSRLESQVTVIFFFSNSKILSASGHDIIHFPGLIYYLGFSLWHLWLSPNQPMHQAKGSQPKYHKIVSSNNYSIYQWIFHNA